MPVVLLRTTLPLHLLFHSAGADCSFYSPVPSSAFTSWKHTSPKMQLLICASFLPDCLSYFFRRPSPVFIMRLEEAKSHSISVAPDYYLILSSTHFSFSVSDWVPTERPMLPGFHRQQYSAFSSTNYVAEMLCWNGSRFSRG